MLVLDEILTKENLLYHAEVLAKKGCTPGYDGQSAHGMLSWLQINGDRFCRELLSGAYRPMPAIGFRTAKKGGGHRQLVRLTAIDTVVQQTLLDGITPQFEAIFSDHSFAYRQGRGLTAALNRYIFHGNRHKYVAKIDVIHCYDNINHDKLSTSLEPFVPDERTRNLLRQFIEMPLEQDGNIAHPNKGLLQGMPLAPLLCNIYLHELDMMLEQSDIDFIRYADDIVVFADAMEEVQSAYNKVADFLTRERELTLNDKKCSISTPARMRYLGYHFESDKRGLIALESTNDLKTAYRNWYSGGVSNHFRSVNIVNDGILRQRDLSLVFEGEGRTTTIPPVTTDSINIYSNVILDAGTLNCALRNGVVIHLFNERAERIGSFYPNSPMRSPIIPHKQLMAYYDEIHRLQIAKEFVLASMHNCCLNIRYHNKQRPNEELEKVLQDLQLMKRKIKETDNHEALLMLEARVRKLYYSCFPTFLLGDAFTFEGRNSRPPKDEINAMISFGNVVLYGLLATELHKSPLDVQMGYLHATNSRRESLNLDLAEIFKPLIVDRTIFSLINRRSIRENHFYRTDNGGVYISGDGKRIFLKAFYEKLDTVVTVGEERMNYKRIITREIQSLTRHFRHEEPYRAFRQVR